MRSALCGVLLCGIGVRAAAQEREVTFEEAPQVTVTGFAVGSAGYDRVQTANSFTAGKLALSLFKPAGDFYLFGQLTTALEDGASATEIDNLIVSWTPHTRSQWTVAFGKFDAPVGFERDDEPLKLIPTNSFNFALARPAKFTGAIVRLTASPRVELAGAVANGWNVDVDNNRGKTGMLRVQWIPADGLTIGRCCVRLQSARCGSTARRRKGSSPTSNTRPFTCPRSRSERRCGSITRPSRSSRPRALGRSAPTRVLSWSSSTSSREDGWYTTCGTRTPGSDGSSPACSARSAWRTCSA